MSSVFSIDFPKPTSYFSNAYNFLTSEQKAHKVGINFLNWTVRNILVITLLSFAKIFTFFTVVLVLEDRHIMHYLHKYDIMYDHM